MAGHIADAQCAGRESGAKYRFDFLTVVAVHGMGAKVVVDGFREADDRNALTFIYPFGRSVGVVTADGHQCVDFVTFQVFHDLRHTVLRILFGGERIGAAGAQRGAAVCAVVRHVGQVNHVAVTEQALPALADSIHLEAQQQRPAAHIFNAGVDGGGVAAAG